jgi:hypothetical protein
MFVRFLFLLSHFPLNHSEVGDGNWRSYFLSYEYPFDHVLLRDFVSVGAPIASADCFFQLSKFWGSPCD